MKRYCTRCAAEITAALEVAYWADGKNCFRFRQFAAEVVKFGGHGVAFFLKTLGTGV